MREAHPVADLFPMLAADELIDLAADIAQRGLLQPIVLDSEGRILDGRNRYAACEMASVEPTFTTYEGEDPDGYALAVNLARRNLNKGQKAVVIARAYKNYTEEDRRIWGVSKQYVSWARTVLEWAAELADAVVSSVRTLEDVYKVAAQRKKDAETVDNRMAVLGTEAPDLAEQVLDETNPMTVSEAFAAFEERRRKKTEEQRDARALLARIVNLTTPESISNGFVRSWAKQLGEPDEELDELLKRSEQAAHILLDLATERRNEQ